MPEGCAQEDGSNFKLLWQRKLCRCERSGEQCQHIRLEQQIRGGRREQDLGLMGGCATGDPQARGIPMFYNSASITDFDLTETGHLPKVQMVEATDSPSPLQVPVTRVELDKFGNPITGQRKGMTGIRCCLLGRRSRRTWHAWQCSTRDARFRAVFQWVELRSSLPRDSTVWRSIRWPWGLCTVKWKMSWWKIGDHWVFWLAGFHIARCQLVMQIKCMWLQHTCVIRKWPRHTCKGL